MSVPTPQLNRFARRVRALRAWRGLWSGLFVGGCLALAWSSLDYFGIYYAEWSWLGALVATAGLLGLGIGALRPIPEAALAASIDRRAHLEDRLVTARSAEAVGPFSEDLLGDAASHLAAIQPRRIFPIRVGRGQGATLAVGALAAAIFLLGNMPLLLSDEQRQEQAELKREGAKVERVIKENLNDPELAKKMSPAERRLADELLKLKRDLDKNRLDKEHALQRANDIAKQARELMQQRASMSQTDLAKSDTALDALRKQAMDQVGLKDASPDLMKLTDAQRESANRALQQQMSQSEAQAGALQSKLHEIQQKLQDPHLSKEARAELERQAASLQTKSGDLDKQLKSLAKQMHALKLSEEAQRVFAKMMNDPLYRQVQAFAQKLAENASQMAKTGQSALTKEQMDEIQKQLEDFARSMKDDQAMHEYLQGLLDAMKDGKLAQQAGMIGLGMGLHLPGSGMAAATQDIYAGDSGKINKLDKGEAGKGTTQATVISGQRRDAGEESYIEIKAPTMVGTRSSVPYTQVLPNYRKRAEAALDRQEIPKQHQKRVKAYFDSLAGR